MTIHQGTRLGTLLLATAALAAALGCKSSARTASETSAIGTGTFEALPSSLPRERAVDGQYDVVNQRSITLRFRLAVVDRVEVVDGLGGAKRVTLYAKDQQVAINLKMPSEQPKCGPDCFGEYASSDAALTLHRDGERLTARLSRLFNECYVDDRWRACAGAGTAGSGGGDAAGWCALEGAYEIVNKDMPWPDGSWDHYDRAMIAAAGGLEMVLWDDRGAAPRRLREDLGEISGGEKCGPYCRKFAVPNRGVIVTTDIDQGRGCRRTAKVELFGSHCYKDGAWSRCYLPEEYRR